MKRPKLFAWGLMIAAALWALAGLRDAFAPGFLSMNGRVVSSSTIAVDFAIAAMFFIIAASFTGKHAH